MKIGDLARLSDTPVETVRYYEKAGLVPAPARTQSNYRHYDESHVARLRFIRHCRALDLSLDEIRTLLRVRDDRQADCADADALIEAHLGHVRRRIEELRQLEGQLQALRASCGPGHHGEDCGILAQLEQAQQSGPSSAPPACVGGVHGLKQGT